MHIVEECHICENIFKANVNKIENDIAEEW
jgi:hypothetical protein